MERGEISWASLPEPTGSEAGFRRPILIIQSNKFNRSRIHTVIGVVLSSNKRLALAPGNVFISADETGLNRDSVVNVSQVITVDKSFLTESVGRLSMQKFLQVEDGLRLILSL